MTKLSLMCAWRRMFKASPTTPSLIQRERHHRWLRYTFHRKPSYMWQEHFIFVSFVSHHHRLFDASTAVSGRWRVSEMVLSTALGCRKWPLRGKSQTNDAAVIYIIIIDDAILWWHVFPGRWPSGVTLSMVLSCPPWPFLLGNSNTISLLYTYNI